MVCFGFDAFCEFGSSFGSCLFFRLLYASSTEIPARLAGLGDISYLSRRSELAKASPYLPTVPPL